MEKQLTELVEKLKTVAGPNLRSVTLYGSAAGGEYRPGFSDLNVVCVFDRLGVEELEALSPVVNAWVAQGHPAPMVFPLDELRRSADVFAIELLDIKNQHRLLHGEDVFATLAVPINLHRIEVERELRILVVRLRERYLAAPRDRKAILALLTGSLSSALTLFRHALLAFGEPPPGTKREMADRVAALVGADAAPLHRLLDLREGQLAAGDVDIPATFRAYLDAVARVAEEVDRRLA